MPRITTRRKPRVLKKAAHQTGTSDLRRDRLYKALPPGKRISRTGHIYYEYRKNRSDLAPEEKPTKHRRKKETPRNIHREEKKKPKRHSKSRNKAKTGKHRKKKTEKKKNTD